MTKEKLAKLESLGNFTINGGELARTLRSIEGASPCDTCVQFTEWVIRAAAPLGCVAGEAALTGIFIVADIIFAIGDEILIPLEAVIEVAFGVACGEIGAPALLSKAHEYAVDMCKTAKIC